MERRKRQYEALNIRTQSTLRGGKIEHIWDKSGQLDFVPNRWLRISFAAQDKEETFNNLLTHINVESLREAFNAADGSKALGIDKLSKKSYGKNLEENLKNLVQKIHNGSFKPQDKREVLIPKANGKTRPIAISCFEDKLVEWVIGKILESIYEPLFIRNSFGFRNRKSAHDAIKANFLSLKEDKRPHVVEMDFANFFNSIPHKKLMKTLSKRVTDRRFKGLIGRFLKIGILDHSGATTKSTVGTPQGSVMSPILANIFLNDVLDHWFVEKYGSFDNIIVRYADDAVFFFKSEQEASSFLVALNERIQRFGLTLNPDKTKRIHFGKDENNTFDFLGFTFYWGVKKKFRKLPLKVKTAKKTLIRKFQEFDRWIKETRSSRTLKEIWALAKEKLMGHYTYFGYSTNYPKLLHFYSEAIKSLFKWLNRRSQKRSFNWEQFQQLLKRNPLPKPPLIHTLKQLGWNPYA